MVNLALTSLAIVLCATLAFADYDYSGYGNKGYGKEPYYGYSVEYANSQTFYPPYSPPFPIDSGDCGFLGLDCGNGLNVILLLTVPLFLLLLQNNNNNG